MVRIVDAAEAALAARAGVDIVEYAPSAPPDLAQIEAIRRDFPGALRLAASGELPLPDLVAVARETRADEIAMAADDAAALAAHGGRPAPGTELVATILAGPDNLDAIRRVYGHAASVMLATADDRRLIDAVAIAHLDAVAHACRAAGLRFGLAGDLEAPDVVRLLLLEPDVLGFDAAVRAGHRRDGALDLSALVALRGLVPRHGTAAATADGRVEVTDRVFVRDFVVPLAIGAYKSEVGGRQRVRFSVEADVVREPVAPRDMRDVFSYDIIIETIRVLAERPHVAFVETLAEEVATTLLSYPALTSVTVKVEKLDVIDGAVGIETTRRRPA